MTPSPKSLQKARAIVRGWVCEPIPHCPECDYPDDEDSTELIRYVALALDQAREQAVEEAAKEKKAWQEWATKIIAERDYLKNRRAKSRETFDKHIERIAHLERLLADAIRGNDEYHKELNELRDEYAALAQKDAMSEKCATCLASPCDCHGIAPAPPVGACDHDWKRQLRDVQTDVLFCTKCRETKPVGRETGDVRRLIWHDATCELPTIGPNHKKLCFEVVPAAALAEALKQMELLAAAGRLSTEKLDDALRERDCARDEHLFCEGTVADLQRRLDEAVGLLEERPKYWSTYEWDEKCAAFLAANRKDK